MTLLVSIHDVAPPHLEVVKALREHIGVLGVARATLLVVPDFHGRHPLERAPETVRWLRARAAAGDEICLHGHQHLARGPIAGLRDRIRAALFTAGEGECLTLPGAAARDMLARGRRRLQDLIGADVRGFVAPAWLEPDGFGAALAAAGFGWHEGRFWIERLDADGGPPQRTRTPVVGFATRTYAREIAGRAYARVLVPALGAARGPAGRGRPVRLALHPADQRSPAVMRAAARALSALGRGRAALTYAAALSLGAPGAAA